MHGENIALLDPFSRSSIQGIALEGDFYDENSSLALVTFNVLHGGVTTWVQDRS